ncbi:MAG TPA: pitrilysin family protein [Myxococcota bacterium]|nr:pitrilysin family protein [Myxococcota bacterium]
MLESARQHGGLPTRLRTGFALVLVLALGAGIGRAATFQDPAQALHSTTLRNGLTILTLVDRTTPVVSLQMWVKVGSKDETRYTGIAHLFEHMMFKGSLNLGPEEHARLLEARGGRVNAFTTNDVTVFHEDITPDTLPLAIDLEAERVANLDISEKTLASERQVVLEERRLRTEDNPEGRLLEALFALTFIAHPYRWPVIGWRSDVEAVTVEACRRFFRTFYSPNNLVLVLVGNFDSDTALRQIDRAFGRLEPAAEIPRNPTKEPAQHGERRAIVRFNVRSPIVAAAWHAPAAGHPDGPALDVAGQILSSGRSSRLYRRLVYKEQQALAAQGGYSEMQEEGLFFAYASVRPDGSPDRAEALIVDEVRKLRTEPVSDEELAKAKRELEVDFINGLATTQALAGRIGDDFVTFGRVRSIDERLSALDAVTQSDVQRVANTYLGDDQRSVVRLVPASGEGPSPPKGARPKSHRTPAARSQP